MVSTFGQGESAAKIQVKIHVASMSLYPHNNVLFNTFPFQPWARTRLILFVV